MASQCQEQHVIGQAKHTFSHVKHNVEEIQQYIGPPKHDLASEATGRQLHRLQVMRLHLANQADLPTMDGTRQHQLHQAIDQWPKRLDELEVDLHLELTIDADIKLHYTNGKLDSVDYDEQERHRYDIEAHAVCHQDDPVQSDGDRRCEHQGR